MPADPLTKNPSQIRQEKRLDAVKIIRQAFLDLGKEAIGNVCLENGWAKHELDARSHIIAEYLGRAFIAGIEKSAIVALGITGDSQVVKRELDKQAQGILKAIDGMGQRTKYEGPTINCLGRFEASKGGSI